MSFPSRRSADRLPSHGGDLAAAEARWGRPAEGWLDLSTGINPWPYPVPSLPPTVWTRLPGVEAEAALAAAARHRYRVPAGAGLVAAPGSQALIQALPRLRPPGRVAILGPTYGEHARSWTAAGHAVVAAQSVDDLASLAPVAVVVNPNNPDGRVISPERLAALATGFSARGGLLVIDEAFVDSVPELSLVPRLVPGALVIRSFGKFFGLAGLRLGIAVTAEAGLAEALARLLGPWAVSGPALAIGAVALADDAWVAATRARLAAAVVRLGEVLNAAGVEPVGKTSLFVQARHPEALALWDRLGRAGVLTRAFPDHPDRLRIGLPADEAGFTRLAEALAGG